MILTSIDSIEFAEGAPRVRGDDPTVMSYIGTGLECSPRTRG